MIKKLRVKFIIMSMITVLLLLCAILFITYYMNLHSAVSEADDILTMIPRVSSVSDTTGQTLFLPYESRFFSVTLDRNGNILNEGIKLPDSNEISLSQASEYARMALARGRKKGIIGNYRYILRDGTENVLIEFINIGQQLESVNAFFYTSLLITAACYLVFVLVLLFFSGRFVKPVAASYEKQKQFITNAGHGLKTPLTIIDADVEVLKMDLDENEWLEDIQKQTGQLTSLTNDLVFLSKLDESSAYLKKIEFPFSEMLSETAESFSKRISASGKNLVTEIAPGLTFIGDEKSIHQLVSILLDNAVKYSSHESDIILKSYKHGKNIIISVWNATENPVTKAEAELVFDRFYRIDASLNSEISGHGIGLSVAKAIALSHGGHIHAVPGDEPSFMITVSLPV